MTSRPEPALSAGHPDPRLLPWMKGWLILLAVVFLVPAHWLARTQWQGRTLDRLVLETTLDPARPRPGSEPIDPLPTDDARRVTIGFYLESLGGVSLHDGEWSAVIDVWCRWRDEREDDAFNPFDRLIAVDGTITDARLLAHVDEEGEHYELRRLSVTYTKPFRIRTFPVDEHLLLASFENSAHTRRELLFVPDLVDTAVSHRATLSNYRVGRFHAAESPHTYQTRRGRADIDDDPRRTYSQPRFAILIDRGGLGLFAKMFQALFISVAVALLTCFIKPIHVDPRFGLGVGGLFAVVANAYFVGSLVPETNEFSLADIVNLLGIVTILLSLTQSTLSLYAYETLGRPELSRRFDRAGFRTTLVCFVTALALIMAAASGW
ncbi:MAG: hypothetical protein ACKO1M_04625 [Planctomycetota bacterium]